MPNQAFILIVSMVFGKCGADANTHAVLEHLVYLKYKVSAAKM